MAKFLFWSDLHCEFSPFEIPVPAGEEGARPDAPAREDIDGILIAGDTYTKNRHLDVGRLAGEVWGCPVVMIDGNHEAYDMKRIQKLWEQEDRKIEELRQDGADITLLRGGSAVIGDTRIIGATLWTDMTLYPDRFIGAQMAAAAQVEDYKSIRHFDHRRGIYRRLTPNDTREFHQQDKSRILRLLAEPFDGRTIVMTHHLPVAQMLHPDRIARRDILSAAYASDLASELAQFDIDAWIAGHSHDAFEYILSGCRRDIRFLRNIRGYPTEETDFNPVRILDSNAPRLVAELAGEAPSP